MLFMVEPDAVKTAMGGKGSEVCGMARASLVRWRGIHLCLCGCRCFVKSAAVSERNAWTQHRTRVDAYLNGRSPSSPSYELRNPPQNATDLLRKKNGVRDSIRFNGGKLAVYAQPTHLPNKSFSKRGTTVS